MTRTLERQSRIVRTEQIMGTVVSIHVVVEPDTGAGTVQAVEAAAGSCFAHLADVDRVFSTYRTDSDISRINAGTLAVDRADPRVATVRRACAAAQRLTGGLFSAHFAGQSYAGQHSADQHSAEKDSAGGFDPTGYVKGWAVEAAHRECLRPLLEVPGVAAVGVSAGGDMQLETDPGADWLWQMGIADPSNRGRVVATVPIRTGAVATSGTAERGAHIIDPRTGVPATAAVSATVIADSLTHADVWATAAVVAGPDAMGWVAAAPETSGLLIAGDGRIVRWGSGRVV